MAKDFFSINELAENLNIKKSTLYSIVRNGDLPHYRIGRIIRFKRTDIESWLENHRNEAVDPEKKAKDILIGVRNPKIDIDKIVKKTIEEAKTSRYNLAHGKSDHIRGLRKEVSNGTL
jgi:excisionase family DNA binding protein